MADAEHLAILNSGVDAWNKWRKRNRKVRPSLNNADLARRDLRTVNLTGAALRGADLFKSDLRRANMRGSRLHYADLSSCKLDGANLSGARLQGARLIEAVLRGVDLSYATLVEADLTRARLEDCRVFAISGWKNVLSETVQKNLVISKEGEGEVAVDDIEVAQFVYLLLNNDRITSAIETIGRKGVLILGRFTPERKRVLDAIRDKLRELGFVPMLFDFEKPEQRDFTETIKILAGLSCFVIVDITNPRSSPLELQATVPDYMVPFVPILQEGEEPFSMFEDLQKKYGAWVLGVLVYDSPDRLVERLHEAVVRPALKLVEELLIRKAGAISRRHISDYGPF